jgi:hypothetical protein
MLCSRCNGKGYLIYPNISYSEINNKSAYDILNEAMNENYDLYKCSRVKCDKQRRNIEQRMLYNYYNNIKK